MRLHAFFLLQPLGSEKYIAVLLLPPPPPPAQPSQCKDQCHCLVLCPRRNGIISTLNSHSPSPWAAGVQRLPNPTILRDANPCIALILRSALTDCSPKNP